METSPFASPYREAPRLLPQLRRGKAPRSETAAAPIRIKCPERRLSPPRKRRGSRIAARLRPRCPGRALKRRRLRCLSLVIPSTRCHLTSTTRLFRKITTPRCSRRPQRPARLRHPHRPRRPRLPHLYPLLATRRAGRAHLQRLPSQRILRKRRAESRREMKGAVSSMF